MRFVVQGICYDFISRKLELYCFSDKPFVVKFENVYLAECHEALYVADEMSWSNINRLGEVEYR